MKMNFARIMRLLAQRHRDHEAIVNIERNRRLTFHEYHLLTNRIANALTMKLGVRRGDNFMLILENDNLSLMQIACVLKQEGTVVLTNMRDSATEHAWQVELLKPKVVFIEADLANAYYDMLRSHGCEIVVMDKPGELKRGMHEFWTLVADASDGDTEAELDVDEHIFMLRFTGGTTGRGKCAQYSINNILACRDGAYANPGLDFDSTARALHVTPLSHGSQMMFYPTLFAGGTNMTLNRLDLDQWHRAVEVEKVTHSFLVPTVLYRLLEMQRATPRNFSSLRTVIYGAAPMSPTKLGDLIECFGPIFAQGYAATEVPMFISILDKGDHSSANETGVKRLSSAGRPTSGVEVFITDEKGKVLPTGETGEIRIRCPAVIKGYHNNAEGTAAEFIDGAWKSGDLGYIDEAGFLYIVDRLKDMIITGGFNVYAVEVEAALASHPSVHMAAVVGIPHPEWGEAVHAEVILRPGQDASCEQLMTYVKDKLGSYKAPKSVVLVKEMPVSVVGKVLRRQVREKYWQGMSKNIN